MPFYLQTNPSPVASIGSPQQTSAPAPAFVTTTSLPQILHLYFCPRFVMFSSLFYMPYRSVISSRNTFPVPLPLPAHFGMSAQPACLASRGLTTIIGSVGCLGDPSLSQRGRPLNQSFLLNYTTCNPGATAAKRGWRVCIIVASGMDHK